MAALSITNETRATIPRAIFRDIAAAALPKSYDLNLVIIGAGEMRKMNLMYRNIDKPTDILSFPLGKNEGEMYICLSETRKEAKNFDRTYDNFLVFLFIHGCAHLKGYDHGATMERIESKLRRKFKV